MLEHRVMRAIFALSDEMEYNIYDAADIAEYLALPHEEIQKTIQSLYHQGYLGECMSIGDDGYETFYLTQAGRDAIAQ